MTILILTACLLVTNAIWFCWVLLLKRENERSYGFNKEALDLAQRNILLNESLAQDNFRLLEIIDEMKREDSSDWWKRADLD